MSDPHTDQRNKTTHQTTEQTIYTQADRQKQRHTGVGHRGGGWRGGGGCRGGWRCRGGRRHRGGGRRRGGHGCRLGAR